MATKGDPELLARVRAELRAAQAKASAAHTDLGNALTRVNEAIRGVELASDPFAPAEQVELAYPAGKRQALFYWAVFLAGGEPDGEFVSEGEIAPHLALLTLEGKAAPAISEIRERFMKRRNWDFIEIDQTYRLLARALEPMEKHRPKIGNLPTNL